VTATTCILVTSYPSGWCILPDGFILLFMPFSFFVFFFPFAHRMIVKGGGGGFLLFPFSLDQKWACVSFAEFFAFLFYFKFFIIIFILFVNWRFRMVCFFLFSSLLFFSFRHDIARIAIGVWCLGIYV
jgi:hypothetical protein